MPDWLSFIGVGSFFTVICWAFFAGRFWGDQKRRMTAVEKAVNGEGPFQKKIDSVASKVEKLGIQVTEDQKERNKLCAQHHEALCTVKGTMKQVCDSVAIIDRRVTRIAAKLDIEE